MSDKQLVLRDDEVTSLAPHYGSRREITHLANQVKTMIPGGDRLNTSEAMAVAWAAVQSDANLLRGDIYAYKDPRTGQLIIVDGYKLLVREAKRICDYQEFDILLTDEEKRINKLEPEDMAYWCYVLRNDHYQSYLQEMKTAKEFGLNYREARREALNFSATRALGVVRTFETWSKKKNKPIDPPKTMTWAEKAKQRGLKHALRRAYALPSPKEIAARTWDIDGTDTRAEDWEGVEIYRTRKEQEQAAKRAAWHRQAQENPIDSETLAAANAAMRDNGDDDPLALWDVQLAEAGEHDESEVVEGVLEEPGEDPPPFGSLEIPEERPNSKAKMILWARNIGGLFENYAAARAAYDILMEQMGPKSPDDAWSFWVDEVTNRFEQAQANGRPPVFNEDNTEILPTAVG